MATADLDLVKDGEFPLSGLGRILTPSARADGWKGPSTSPP